MSSERSGWPPAPDDFRVVIGDIHGDWETLWRLLKKADVVDKLGHKKPHRHVTFIGDIGHWGHKVFGGDYYALLIAAKYGDAFIGGNHEGSLVFDTPTFGGVHPRHLVSPEALRLLDRMTSQGRWQAAVAIDGWLLTHAGLHPAYQEQLAEFISDPVALADQINFLFYKRLFTHKHQDLFDSVGPIRSRIGDQGYDYTMSGEDEPGGVFWMDAREMVGASWVKADGSICYPSILDRNRVKQIVGHTASINGPANPGPMFYGDSFIVNDVGSGLSGRGSALVKSADQTAWTPLTVTTRRKGGPAPDVSESPEFIRAHHPILKTILLSDNNDL